MTRVLFLLIFISAFTLSLTSEAGVWADQNQWSSDWEQQYSQWVKEKWNIQIFATEKLADGSPNPYFGMQPDCADTVYSMRAIFAYENKLPFIVRDPTGGDVFLSNKMSRYNDLPASQRFKKFLKYIYAMMGTISLPADTYPVAINQTAVRPGTLILTTRKNHHTWSIKEILPVGVPWLVYNSMVGTWTSSVLQERQSWPNPAWVFLGNFTAAGNAGIRDWRPQAYLSKAITTIPGYSTEQYQIPIKTWNKTVQSKLATTPESDEAQIKRLFEVACTGMQTRVAVVDDALKYLASTNNACMNYPVYDTYSTPNRDRRVFDDLLSLRTAYRDILTANNGINLPPETHQHLNKIFPFIHESALEESKKMQKSSLDEKSVCIVNYADQKQMDLAEAKRRLFTGLMSNNPIDDKPYRWGDLKGPSARAKSCSSWDPWVPDYTNVD